MPWSRRFRVVLDAMSTSPKARVIEVNKWINQLGRERRLTEALAQLPQLRAQHLKPTTVTYNVLISACARCSNNRRAAELFAEMRREGLEPNIITYATVIKGFCLSGALQEAEEAVTQAATSRVGINDRITTSLLRGCLIWGDVERVLPFVRAHRDVMADSVGLEYAARCLCMGLRVAEAEALVALGTATAALLLALAGAHIALLDWASAEDRVRRAEQRIASGLDARLHTDRDDERHDDEAMSTFLSHRQVIATSQCLPVSPTVPHHLPPGEAMSNILSQRQACLSLDFRLVSPCACL